MKITFLRSLAFLAFTVLTLTGCIKDEIVELTNQGNTFVKIVEAPERNLFFEPFSDTRPVSLFTVSLDANSSASLNTAQPVSLTLVPDYIARYNEANGTHYELLPDSLFTTAVQNSGNVYTMDMASGEFAKDFTIQMDGSKWDLENVYAMAFAVSDASGAALSSGKDTIMVTLSVVNAWDGAYEVTGEMTDFTNATLTGYFPFNYHLVTAGTDRVAGFDPELWGDYMYPITSGTSISGYGSFGPVFIFDPETNKIIDVQNYWGQPAGNTRSASLDPSGVNAYDPATGTIDVKFFMHQPSVVTAAPHIRVAHHWIMKYKGPR